MVKYIFWRTSQTTLFIYDSETGVIRRYINHKFHRIVATVTNGLQKVDDVKSTGNYF